MLFAAICALSFAQQPDWSEWLSVGPFPSGPPPVALDDEFPPEELLARFQRGGDPQVRGSIRTDSGKLTWTELPAAFPLNLARAQVTEGDAVSYLYRSFDVEDSKPLAVELLAAGSYRVWLNGGVVAEMQDPVVLASSTLELELRPRVGRNHLLIKVAGSRASRAFGMRQSFRWRREVAAMQSEIDGAIDAAAELLLDRQLIDGTWRMDNTDTYPTGITPLCVYALLKAGVSPEHHAIRRALEATSRYEFKRTYSAGFLVLALCATEQKQHKERVGEIVEWLVESLPPGKIYGYPGSPDMSNHVVAALAVNAAQRVYDIDVPKDYWEKVLEGTLALLGPEERVVSPDGGTIYERGFTYRHGEASGSMTSAGVTIVHLGLNNPSAKIPPRLRKAAENSIQPALTWLDNHWAIGTNPPARSWGFFHLYGLERIGSLMDLEVIGTHAWYLEGARWLIDNKAPNGSWGPDNETQTCMGILFLKRATSYAVTSEESGPLTKSYKTSSSDDVTLRASGDTPLTIWVAESRVEASKASFFASRVGHEEVLSLGNGKIIRGRPTLQTRFARSGRWEVWCELETAVGTLLSPRLEVTIRLVATPELLAAAASPLRNELLQAEDLSWRSSGKLNDSHPAAKVADGNFATEWLCEASDVDPWFMFEVPKGVRARQILLTANSASRVPQGATRPASARVIVNKREIFDVDFPTDPWEKAVLKLPKRMRVKQLEIHLTALRSGTLGAASAGLAEVELLDTK